MDIKELTAEMYRFVRAKGWLESDSKASSTLAEPGDLIDTRISRGFRAFSME